MSDNLLKEEEEENNNDYQKKYISKLASLFEYFKYPNPNYY